MTNEILKNMDGGPAFPGSIAATTDANGEMHIIDSVDRHDVGMTLRDYFASRILPIVIEKCGLMENRSQDEDIRINQCYLAYKYADAMIAARKFG